VVRAWSVKAFPSARIMVNAHALDAMVGAGPAGIGEFVSGTIFDKVDDQDDGS